MVEADLDRAEERADTSEHKIIELEEELRVVGNNLKSLEVSEEKANQREEAYKEQIKTLTTRMKRLKLALNSLNARCRNCRKKSTDWKTNWSTRRRNTNRLLTKWIRQSLNWLAIKKNQEILYKLYTCTSSSYFLSSLLPPPPSYQYHRKVRYQHMQDLL